MYRGALLTIVLLLVPTLCFATDLRITDSSGADVIVKNASIDYSGALGAAVRESKGIRLEQGDATVTVKWKDIESLTIEGAGSEKAERLDVNVRMRNGRQLAALLHRPRDAKLRGTSELGEYSLDLYKVRSIQPLR